MLVGKQVPRPVDGIHRCRDDDMGHAARSGQRPHRVDQHRHPAHRPEGLRVARAEPLAATGCDDERGGLGTGRCVVAGGVHASSSELGRAKTIRPFAVVSTLVTRTDSSWPTEERACSTTTIVPSSR